MTTKSRVEQYLSYGYSARRLAELFDWPYERVKALKLGEEPRRNPGGSIKDARYVPDIDAAVRMVLLNGVDVKEAALSISGRVWEVAAAVNRAKREIERLENLSKAQTLA